MNIPTANNAEVQLACTYNYIAHDYGTSKSRLTVMNAVSNTPLAPFASWPPPYWEMTNLVWDSTGHYVQDCNLVTPGNRLVYSSWKASRGGPTSYTCDPYGTSSLSLTGKYYCDHQFAYYSIYQHAPTCNGSLPVITRVSYEINPVCHQATLTQYYCNPPPTNLIPSLLSQDGMVIKRYFGLSDQQCLSVNNNSTYLASTSMNVYYTQSNTCLRAIEDSGLSRWTKYACLNDTFTGNITITETKYYSETCSSSTISSTTTFIPNVCGTNSSIYPQTTFACTSYTTYSSYQPIVSTSSSTGAPAVASSTADGSRSAGTSIYASPLSTMESIMTVFGFIILHLFHTN